MMKIHGILFFLACCLIPAAVFAGAESDRPVSFDFSTRPDPALASCGGAVTFADGLMKFPMEGHGDLVLARVDYTRPFQLDFTMRPVRADYAKSRVMIKITSSEPDTSLLIFSHEKGNGVFVIYTQKGVRRFYDFHPCDVMATTGAWKKFRLVVSTSSLEFFLDGKPVFTKSASILPVNFISISRHGCELEFDDFKIEPAAKERTDISAQPFRFTAEKKTGADGGTIAAAEGEAVRVPAGERITRTLVFPVADLLRNQSGAIMFWAALPASPGERRLLACDDGSRDVLSLTLRPWETVAAIRRKAPLPDYGIALGLNPWRYGADNLAHVALTWDREAVRLYVNAMPYSTIQYDRSDIPPLSNPDLEGGRRLLLPAGITFDGLKLFQRPVSAREIYDEYRSRMPIDLVMQTQMFRSDRPVKLVLNAAPGGFFMHPMPTEAPIHPAKVEISAVLAPASGGDELFRAAPVSYDVSQSLDIPLPELTLKPGNYLLSTETRYGGSVFRRTFAIDVAAPPAAPQPATREDFRTGREIYSCDFEKTTPAMLGDFRKVVNGGLRYLEGTNENFGRFGFEVKFPPETMGKPVLIEIDWPDDKPRLAAHYIYRPSQGYCDRDRLQQGVQSGVEYPLTGKTVTTRYLFWPGFSEYLFEFRNLAAGRPAAVSALRVYEIEGGELPALAIETPKGLPGRSFGHLDEDQTFYMNLNRDYYDHVLRGKGTHPNFDVHVFGEMGKYFAYTGMNSFLYNLLRYYYVFYMTDTNTPPGFPPEKAGGLDYMLDTLAENGISFLCGINISSIPEVAHSPVTAPDAEKRGWLMGDRTGNADGGMFGSRSPNYPTNPEVAKFYLAHIRKLAELLGKHGNVTGFALWTVPWKNLAWGYDDYNINLFSRETGIAVPKEKRYEFLTGPKRREWLRWRADKTTALVKAIADTVRAVNPKWELLVFPQDLDAFRDPATQGLPGGVDAARDRKKYYYENFGIDVDALERLDHVFFSPHVMPSRQPQVLYQSNRLEPVNELTYDAKADRELFRGEGRSRRLAGIYHDYFESIGVKNPSPTLLPEKYSCFFQDTDVKPWGRYFLKELTSQVAASDAQNIVFGAQPLGALGREAETREFARAYRALPALPFRDVPGAEDPVAVRYLETENGTYFYLASLLWAPCRVTVDFADGAAEFRDLGTGKPIDSDTIELDAYQLRSFLIPGKRTAIRSIRVEAPETVVNYYADLLRRFRERLREIGGIRGSEAVAKESEIVARAEQCVASGRYGEAHRLLFSVPLQQFMKSSENAKLVARMQEMLEKNHIAVNCGSDEFYSAPDGRLFFPDAGFEQQGGYGYFGQHKTCKRNIDGLRTDAPGVFGTEAWDIDGYRFRVPDGNYTVRLYMRFAYEPKFNRKNPLDFSLEANGEPLFRNLDFFREMKGDLRNPVILEFKGVKVAGGLLTLKCVPGKDSTVRHFNAVEVIRER